MRPVAVTVIAVLAVAYGVLTLPVKLLVLLSPELFADMAELMSATSEAAIVAIPLPVQMAHGMVGSLVWIAAGVALMKGLNWARWLAIFWAATVLLITLLLLGLGTSLLLKTATFAVMCFFLTNRKASAYFTAAK